MSGTNVVDIFKYAAKKKLRFNYKGVLAVEDLFDLSVEELDNIFKSLNSKLKQVNEESLLTPKTVSDLELETKIEIVKTIVSDKLLVKEIETQKAAISAKKQKILEILATKRDKSLEDKSEDELEAMLNELEG